MAAAAIITIVILLGLWSRYISSDLPVESYYTETTDFGERKEIILSDSTTVILNSKTKLKIPATFIGEVREVELDGEAFSKWPRIPTGLLLSIVGTLKYKFWELLLISSLIRRINILQLLLLVGKC